MKKIFLTLLCLFTGISFSFSQTQKGDKFWVVEGRYSGYTFDNSLNSLQTSKDVTNDVYLGLKKGKFIRNNIAQGLGIDYRYYNYKFSGFNNSSSNGYFSNFNRKTFSVDYFLDRYIPVMNNLYLVVEANSNLSYTLTNRQITNTATSLIDLPTQKIYQLSIGINTGLRYFIGKSFFINAETSLADVSYSYSRTDEYSISNIALKSRLSFYSLNIGIGKNF